MIEKVLKELAERHFEVFWKYEVLTDSIDIQLYKRNNGKLYKIVRKVGFDEIRCGSIFEFFMVQILKNMAQELEQRREYK